MPCRAALPRVTMLVFDAKEALVRADMQIARLAVADYKSCILVANKCDLLSDRELSNVEEQATHPPVPRTPSLAPRPYRGASRNATIVGHHRRNRQRAPSRQVRQRLPMLRYAPIVRTCALTGEGLNDALDLAVEAARWRRAGEQAEAQPAL